MNHLLNEIEKEKQEALNKKKVEREAMQKTLIQNEENRKLQSLALKREKEDDVRAAEEYTKVLDKQENERKAYFRNIENKSNNFLAQMTKTVLKDAEQKNKEEEEKVLKYEREKEERLCEEDKLRIEQIRLNKRSMREFLDKQVEEKKKFKDFQNYLDKEQARIWNMDKEILGMQEKEIGEKVLLILF